jgi:pimeloyl-ACP methyl ester carboxylesterase
MPDRTATNGDVTLATESFGDPSDPPILLVMGAMASMLWWPDGFVAKLADGGRHVIRYDNRDTGLSTTFPPGEAHYSLADMARDAVAVMDAYRLGVVHLVGMSLGGIIAQRVVLAAPDRVRTLTLISTTPLGVEGLPPMAEAYAEHSATAEKVDWNDRASVLDYMMRDARMLAGTRHPHDADAARDLIGRDLDRSPSFASATNHFTALGGDGDAEADASAIAVPTLVIHGTADPIFPIAHGEAMARTVGKGALLRLEGGGHELHEGDWPRMAEAILRHTSG